jgi:CheY-like chemotaxis protein
VPLWVAHSQFKHAVERVELTAAPLALARTRVGRMQLNSAQIPSSSSSDHDQRRSMPAILCVDDDPEIGKICQIRLSRHGIAVVCAANGTEGFEIAREKRPDLILLDLCMPHEDGNQVLSRLRRDPRTRDIPVWMLTGGDSQAVQRQASQHRADAYLSKPINFAEVLARLAPLTRMASRST